MNHGELEYVEVFWSEQWAGWQWSAVVHGSPILRISPGEYTRRADAERGAERYVANVWPDYDLGPWT